MRIDILIKPGEKCEQHKSVLGLAARAVNARVEINQTSDFAAFSNCAIHSSQTPAIIINGNVEFTGKTLDLEAVKKRLAEIVRFGGSI